MAERTTWTDERIDDRLSGMGARFDRIDLELREFRAEMRDFRSELRTEFRDLRGDLNRFQDRAIQVAFGMVFALFAALVTAILAVT